MTDEEGNAISTPDGHWGADFSMLRFMMPGFAAIHPEDTRAYEQWAQALVDGGYLIENWQCDLSTGFFTIGEKTRARHALGPQSRGLLDLVRSYARADRQTVLNILEEATSTAACFCYCATIVPEDGIESRVFCVGTSDIVSTRGRLQGIFAFPPLNG